MRSPLKDELIHSISSRRACVGIVGLGYVGLPSAVAFAGEGLRVIGFDVAEDKVTQINRGESYVGDVESEELAALVESGKLEATSDLGRLGEPDIILVSVPTPLNKQREPDLKYVIAVSEHLEATLRKGQLVILESTTYPGTTEEVFGARLSQRTQLRVGEGFYIAFCAERIDPGNAHYTIRALPRVVGGMTPACTEIACALYRTITDTVVQVSSPQAAEMTKLLENTFRSVNIALVNELAQICQKLDIDIWEVITAAATKPFGFMPFYPGPGVGGHCIPVDPLYLTWRARESGIESRFIELATNINASMPGYVIELVVDALNGHRKSVNGSRILIIGVAYKADVDDVRESPALDIIQGLIDKGAEVLYADSLVPELHIEDLHMSATEITESILRCIDCAVIATANKDLDREQLLQHAPLIVDTRNVLEQTSPKVVSL